MKGRTAALSIAGALLVGVGLGAAGSGGGEGSSADPKPASVTAEKEVTPQVCLDALDNAEAALAVASDQFNIIFDVMSAAQAGFEAMAAFDVDAIEAANVDLLAANDRLNLLVPKTRKSVARYQVAATACRDAK